MLASKAGVMKKVMQLMHRWVGGGGEIRQTACVYVAEGAPGYDDGPAALASVHSLS